MDTLRSASLAAAIGAAVLAWGTAANAVETISLEVQEDGVVIASNIGVTGGFATLAASIGDFNFSVTANGVPLEPNPNFGTVTIDARLNTPGTHTLTILATQQNLTNFPSGSLANTLTANFLSGASNVTSIVGTNLLSPTNALFTGSTTLAANTFLPAGGPSQAFGPFNTAVSGLTTFSETERFDITVTGLSDVQASSQIASAVPEPSTWGMMLLGFVGLAFAFRQSRRKVALA
jgi:hypothetical protein